MDDGSTKIDGGWSPWSSQWVECTRTCGGGIQWKERTCTKPTCVIIFVHLASLVNYFRKIITFSQLVEHPHCRLGAYELNSGYTHTEDVLIIVKKESLFLLSKNLQVKGIFWCSYFENRNVCLTEEHAQAVLDIKEPGS